MSPNVEISLPDRTFGFLSSKPTKCEQQCVERKKSTEKKHGETRLIRYINATYRRWAYFVDRHTTAIIIISIAVSIICTVKVVKTPYQNDLTGYVPYGARSRDEYAIREEFSNLDGRGVLLMALVLAKDNGTVLKEEILAETVKIYDIILTNFTIPNHVNGKNETFREFCRSFCVVNEPMRQFYNGFKVQQELLQAQQPLNERLILSYPVSYLYGRSLNIQSNFAGVVFVNDSSVNGTLNEAETIASTITNMVSVKMFTLLFQAEKIGGWTEQDIRRYELSIVHYFQKEYPAEHVRVNVVSFYYVDAEITRAGLSMLPYLIVGFAIMSVCSTVSTLISAAYMQQISFHKIYLAIFACICPFMANATAIGILLSVGLRYGSILCVTPFLVLAIGVDDAYLMIHAWQRVARKCKIHPTKEDCVAYRLAEVMCETGPAILISALTNILADAVGTFTGSPEITLLCYGNMGSIFMDFIYQVTFYSAIMCIAARFEMNSENERQNTHSIAIHDDYCATASSCCAQTSLEFHDRVKDRCNAFLNGYIKWVTSASVAILVVILWAVFIVVSILGIMRIKIELTPAKLFSQDSPLIETDHLRMTYQRPQFTMGQFFVNHPGNLSDPERLGKLNQMVFELEHMNGSWGPESSHYFVRDFIAYENVSDESEDGDDTQLALRRNGSLSLFNEKDLKGFLEWPEYEYWKGFIKFNETSGELKKFFFTTAYFGKQLRFWPERGVLLNKWRRIIDRYRDDFNVSAFHDDGIFLDLIDNMPTDAWQSGLGTLLCMAFICFIFLYDTFTVIVVSAAIVSIMTGIVGIVSWMGVDLEPIMMAAMLISIGFSVDIPAHVSYHYNSADAHADHELNVQERLRISLASVGLPALQASLSTNLCVLGLLFIPLYMAQVFVKTMVSCITLCVIHGLLVMPCIFALIEKVTMSCSRRRQSVSPAAG